MKSEQRLKRSIIHMKDPTCAKKLMPNMMASGFILKVSSPALSCLLSVAGRGWALEGPTDQSQDRKRHNVEEEAASAEEADDVIPKTCTETTSSSHGAISACCDATSACCDATRLSSVPHF